jgi:hypothetical protein
MTETGIKNSLFPSNKGQKTSKIIEEFNVITANINMPLQLQL